MTNDACATACDLLIAVPCAATAAAVCQQVVHLMVRASVRLIGCALVMLVGLSHLAAAQDTSTTSAPSAPAQQLLRPEELAQLVSPIALYPDPLLANVLMAS